MDLSSLDYRPLTRIVFGAGCLARLGEMVRDLGARRVLIVSDRGVIEAGHTERGRRSIERAGIHVELFDGVEENPTTRHVRAGVECARACDTDFIVGLGGGSAMDCAKGINFIYSCGGAMEDYQGVGKATGDLLPMVAVPTTGGTGSETQSFALIADETTHMKMACGDKRAACRVALLDPECTLSQPAAVTAATGIDAISHAVETYVTSACNSVSRAFSREAWQLLEANFERVLESPGDIEARGAMQLGASLAGCAIENSMLGAAHSLANPVTARYDVVHGGAVGLFLPHVVRFNARDMSTAYAQLDRDRPGAAPLPSDAAHAERLATRLSDLRQSGGLPASLREWGVVESDLERLADEAARQWTAQFNPRPVDRDDLLGLYRQSYG